MVWTVAVDDLFARADTTAGAALSTTGVGNGWIDNAGGVWSLTGGKLLGSTADLSGYLVNSLIRPVGEAAAGQRVLAVMATSGSIIPACVLRRQNTNTYYLLSAEIPNNTATIYSVDAGAVVSLASVVPSPALVVGHSYSLDVFASGATPTSLSLIVKDLTTPGTVATVTITDSTASLQPAGVAGMMVWTPSAAAATASFSRVTTYTGSPGTTSITAAPSSLTAGTSGQVVTITGSGATLVGATFTLSGGLGAAIKAQSVTSATAASVTINPGLPGNGALTITCSAGGTATVAVAAPALGALNIGFVGDSITAGTNGNPVAAMTALLGVQGYTVTATNRGVSGTTTTDWLPGGTYLPPAITAFQTAGVTVVQVMLGTNDWRTPNNLTPSQHASNLRAIVAALRSAGFLVVLCKSLWILPNEDAGSGSVWPNDVLDRVRDAWRLDMALCDGVGVFAGDTGFNQYTTLYNMSVLDGFGIHPKDTTQNDLLGRYWATAFLQRFGAGITNRWTH